MGPPPVHSSLRCPAAAGGVLQLLATITPPLGVRPVSCAGWTLSQMHSSQETGWLSWMHGSQNPSGLACHNTFSPPSNFCISDSLPPWRYKVAKMADLLLFWPTHSDIFTLVNWFWQRWTDLKAQTLVRLNFLSLLTRANPAYRAAPFLMLGQKKEDKALER